jgi:hypothetical protein
MGLPGARGCQFIDGGSRSAPLIRAHSLACALLVTPGNSRRSSTAADSSPPRSNAMRIAAASASVTTNMPHAAGAQDGDADHGRQGDVE